MYDSVPMAEQAGMLFYLISEALTATVVVPGLRESPPLREEQVELRLDEYAATLRPVRTRRPRWLAAALDGDVRAEPRQVKEMVERLRRVQQRERTPGVFRSPHAVEDGSEPWRVAEHHLGKVYDHVAAGGGGKDLRGERPDGLHVEFFGCRDHDVHALDRRGRSDRERPWATNPFGRRNSPSGRPQVHDAHTFRRTQIETDDEALLIDLAIDSSPVGTVLPLTAGRRVRLPGGGCRQRSCT